MQLLSNPAFQGERLKKRERNDLETVRPHAERPLTDCRYIIESNRLGVTDHHAPGDQPGRGEL